MILFNRLQFDARDVKLLSLMSLIALGIYGVTGSKIIALNGLTSYIFTLVAARLENRRKEKMTTPIDYDAERRKSVNFHPEIKEGNNGTTVQEGQPMVPERIEAPREDAGRSSED